jgi:GGDEF domain-containing protein
MPFRDADDARTVVSALRSLTPADQTFSAGVSTWDREELSAQALHRADVAMYVAKRSGRDCVVPAEPEQRVMEPTSAHE